MNDKLLVALAGLFKVEADVLKAEDPQSFIDGLSDYHVFSTPELDKLKKNSVDKAIELMTDPKQQLPAAIFNRVKGTVHETLENRLKKKYSFTDEAANTEDLIEKIIESKSTMGEGEKDKEIDRLKNLYRDDEKKWKSEVEAARGETEKYIVNETLTKAVMSLPIQGDDNELPEMREVYLNNFKTKHEVKLVNGKVVVFKDGQPVQDKIGDPLPVDEVLKSSRPSFIKFKEANGGRGDEQKEPTTKDKIKTGKDYFEYLQKSGIKPNSREASALYIELKKANPQLNLQET